MRNKILIITLVVSMLLIMYCLCKQNSTIELHNFPNNAEIIYCGEEEIYYYINKTEDNFRDVTIYIYNVKEEKNIEITTFYNTDYIITDLVHVGNNIYIINKESQDNYAITKINTKNKSKQNIYTWRGNISFNYLFNMEDNLVLMNINTIDDEKKNEYTIDIINVNTLKAEQIIKTEFNKEKSFGTIISSICVSDNYIYSFENVESPGKTEFNIVKYNIEGEKINIHNLFLDDFLQFDEPGIYADAVIDVYVKGNYYILSTLNQRKIIYKNHGDGLIKINTPEELYKRYPSKYRVLSLSKESSEKLYFIDSFSEKENIIIFDSKEEKFHEIELPQGIKDYKNVYKNEIGDLIIQTFDKSYYWKGGQ